MDLNDTKNLHMFIMHVKYIDPNNLKLKSLKFTVSPDQPDISDSNFQDKCGEYKNVEALRLQ